MGPHEGDLSLICQLQSLRGQPESLRGLPKGRRVWEARYMVKRAVRGSERLIGGSRGQLEDLGGQIYGQEGSQGF